MDKNFINFHILISHSPSCLNRDDMSMQKSAIYGGKRRVRVSSQSLKRAMRKSAYYQETLGAPSLRTKNLGQFQEWIITQLADRYEPELVRKALAWVSGKKTLPPIPKVMPSHLGPLKRSPMFVSRSMHRKIPTWMRKNCKN